MAVVPRKRKGKVVYGVLTSWSGGKPHWELVGANKEEARRLDKQRRREVKAGTFAPDGLTGGSSVAAYAAGWLAARTNRAAHLDRASIKQHVLSVAWFASLPMEEVRPRHVLKLITQLKAGSLSPKSLSNLMGVLRVMFRDAVIADVIPSTPYVVPRGTLKRSGQKRTPYTAEEALRLVFGDVGARQSVWNALAFFTGARCGEICGLRWKDLDIKPKPLAALSVERQYEGLVLKTERPRVVPVHPVLGLVLGTWWLEWPKHYLRQPGPDDPIVPDVAGRHLRRFAAYKAWRAGCVAAGVTNRSVHSTRHTFITLTQRGGADRRVVELITHNPKGTIVDVYTTRDWAEYCDAVTCLSLDGQMYVGSKPPSETGSDSRTRTRLTSREVAQTTKLDGESGAKAPSIRSGHSKTDTGLDARTESDGAQSLHWLRVAP